MFQPDVVPGAMDFGITATLDHPHANDCVPRAGPEKIIQLGESLFRVYPFETRRDGEARTCPPRTLGCAGIMLDGGRNGIGWVGAGEAVDVCLRATQEPRSTESAKEKVAFCNRQGQTRIYQAERRNRSAALCACGNATGAAAAVLARHLNRRRVCQDVELPDGRVQLHATVVPTNGGWRVEQAWAGVRCDAVEARLNGREVVICTGTFNDYLVVRLSGRAELETFDLPEVLDLWREARRFGAFDDPLRSRLVALATGGPIPCAKFYTCGRMHPGAPLTGLAMLSMAAGQVDWLGAMLRGGRLEHRRGVDSLPAVRDGSRGTEVQFPTIHVVLHGI